MTKGRTEGLHPYLLGQVYEWPPYDGFFHVSVVEYKTVGFWGRRVAVYTCEKCGRSLKGLFRDEHGADRCPVWSDRRTMPRVYLNQDPRFRS